MNLISALQIINGSVSSNSITHFFRESMTVKLLPHNGWMAAIWFGVIQRSLHWSFISKYHTTQSILTPQGSIIECDGLNYRTHWDALYQLILQGWEWRVKEYTVQDCLWHGTDCILCSIGLAIQTSDCDMVCILNKFCDWAVEDDLNAGNYI